MPNTYATAGHASFISAERYHTDPEYRARTGRISEIKYAYRCAACVRELRNDPATARLGKFGSRRIDPPFPAVALLPGHTRPFCDTCGD